MKTTIRMQPPQNPIRSTAQSFGDPPSDLCQHDFGDYIQYLTYLTRVDGRGGRMEAVHQTRICTLCGHDRTEWVEIPQMQLHELPLHILHT